MNRGPSNYFLILCDVIIVLPIVIDDTISSTQNFFFIKNFICLHLSDNCNLLIIISFISYLFLCWVAGIFILFALYDFIPQLFLLTSSRLTANLFIKLYRYFENFIYTIIFSFSLSFYSFYLRFIYLYIIHIFV